jgi:hypothetical protein
MVGEMAAVFAVFYRPIFGSHGTESYPSVAEIEQEGERFSSVRTSSQDFAQ